MRLGVNGQTRPCMALALCGTSSIHLALAFAAASNDNI